MEPSIPTCWAQPHQQLPNPPQPPPLVQLYAKGVRGIGPYKNTLVGQTPTFNIDASVSGRQAGGALCRRNLG